MMNKAIVYIIIAVFLALVIQPNIAIQLKSTSRVPVNTDTQSIMTNDTVDLTTCESRAIICLDAAFGGSDSGYSQEGKTDSKDITLDIALKTGDKLEQAGYTVVYTRDSDDITTFSTDSDSANYRLNSAKDQGANYFFRIEVNSDSDNLTRGYTIFTQPTQELIDLAGEISNQLQSINYSQFQGTDSDHYGNFPILNDDSLPSAFIELGYVTNIQDYNQLTSEEMTDKIASAIAKSFLTVIN